MGFVEDKDVRDKLREPFPKSQIGKLPATNKRPALDYVGHAAVSQRLNDVVPGWTYSITERFLWENECWVEGIMVIDGISRVEYGDGKNPKDAVGNFIRRAAMRFGVALDLWSRQELLSEGATAPQEPAAAPATQRPQETSGTGSVSSGASEAPAGPARLQSGEQPVSDTTPPASPEASPGEQAGGEGSVTVPDDPPAAAGDYDAPANEEQWIIARQHIGAPPKVVALYEQKHGVRKKKAEITQLELAELIEDALKKVDA